MEAGRMEAFSDGVIAIIVTIMVLDLRPTGAATLSALSKQWPIFLAYALSFTLVAIYWVNHHHLLQTARRVSTGTLWLNTHWLFWLSLFPFATAWLGSSRGAPFPIALYGVLSVVVAIAYLLLTRSLTQHNAHVAVVASLSRHRQIKNLAAMSAMVAAIPMAYIWAPLAIALLAMPALAYFLPERWIE